MTLKQRVRRQIDTGIIGDERDYDALVAHLDTLPDEGFDSGAFARMTDEEFARSLAM